MNCREDRRRRDPDAVRAARRRRPTCNGPTTCSARPTTAGAELAVLPEMFNTGYGLCPDFGPYAEGRDGPTLTPPPRAGAGSGGWRSPPGSSSATGRHLYDSLAFVTPDGDVHVYRKRNLVFWERFRFRPGRDAAGRRRRRWGRIGFAICADMIYRKVWHDYRDRIDLAVVVGGLARLRRPRHGPEALAARPRRAALGGDPGQGRARPGHPGRLRQPVRRDPDDDPGPRRRRSPTASPARAASATAGTAPRSAPGSRSRSLLVAPSPSTPSED